MIFNIPVVLIFHTFVYVKHMFSYLCLCITHACITFVIATWSIEIRVQYQIRGEDHHRPSLLSDPLVHMYILCMYVCYHEISNK